LGEFVPQVRQRDVRAIALKQRVDAVLSAPTALGTFQPEHVEFGGGLAKRVRTVRHRHNQLSRLSARSICAVALSTSDAVRKKSGRARVCVAKKNRSGVTRSVR
jgi:hypothetical protein